MGIVLHVAAGHAETPSSDGWFHCAPTGRLRLILDGPADELTGLTTALWHHDLVVERRIDAFHDGPGEQSCPACRPHPPTAAR